MSITQVSNTQNMVGHGVILDTSLEMTIGGIVGGIFGGPFGLGLGATIGGCLGRYMNSQALGALENGETALREGRIDLAKFYFKKAGSLEVGYAYQKIGLLKEQAGNIPSAAKAYQKALEQKRFPYKLARNDLDRVLDAAKFSADAANRVGEMYHNGDGIQRDYFKAFEWYERALDIDPAYAQAHKNMGILHEKGLVCGLRDAVMAARCYRNAFDYGLQEAEHDLARICHNLTLSKKERKVIEREAFIAGFKKHGPEYFTEIDTKGFYPLQRALNGQEKQRLYKHAAQLIVDGSPTMFQLGLWRRSSEEHNAASAKLSCFIERLIELRQKPQHSAPTILFRRIIHNNRNSMHPNPHTLAEIEKLYEDPLIRPIIDLAAIASKNCHRLSGRKKLVNVQNYDLDYRNNNADYDSDEDETNDIVNKFKKLTVIINSNSGNIENVWHNPTANRSGGVYIVGTSNICGAEGRTTDGNWARGTLIHELTHFVAYEVFANSCLPYYKDDNATRKHNEKVFTMITKTIRERARTTQLPPDKVLLETINDIFDSELYNGFTAKVTEICHQRELIVKVPEILAQYGTENGLKYLKAQIPEVLDFYKGVFLPEVISHTEKCRKIVSGGYPMRFLEIPNNSQASTIDSLPHEI